MVIKENYLIYKILRKKKQCYKSSQFGICLVFVGSNYFYFREGMYILFFIV